MCIDWSQFVPTMIATFIGFLLAIIGEGIFTHIQNSSERRFIVTNIKEELNEIKDRLNELKADEDYVSPIKYCYWQGLTNSNKLHLIYQKKWFYKIQKLYGDFEDLNKWYTILTEGKIDVPERKEEVVQLVEDTKKELLQKISDILKEDLSNKKP